ncbi:MAG: hypothetical protein AB1505_21900 [Candidatus Latescibacterota bacterium]
MSHSGGTVTSPAGTRLRVDADRGVWSLEADGRRVAGEAGLQLQLGPLAPCPGEEPLPLAASTVLSFGPARCATDSTSDRLGRGKRVVLERTLPGGLHASAALTLLAEASALAVDLALENRGAVPLGVLALRPACDAKIDLGGPAERCTVLSSDYWFAERRSVRLDEQAETTEWWSTAVVDRSSERALAIGIAEAANAGVSFCVWRDGSRVRATVSADLSPGRSPSPLRLLPGAQFRLCRLLFVVGQQVHAGLELYAELVARNAPVALRHRTYAGLFTGYSSSPDLTTVVPLDQARVARLLGVLRDKVGRYGLDYEAISGGQRPAAASPVAPAPGAAQV